MSDAVSNAGTREIVVDEVLPHSPSTIWTALTAGPLIARWLRMTPTGFEPVAGNRFTYRTTPAGAWDGTIQCEVLEAIPEQRLVYSWTGGDAGNVGYGAPLDTVVTFTLSRVDAGTRLRLVHSGFVSPQNDTAFTAMSQGWKSCARRIGEIADGQDSPGGS